MKSLFNEYEAYSPAGADLSLKFRTLTQEIIKEACEDFSTREVTEILVESIEGDIADIRLTKAIAARKAKREAKQKAKEQDAKTVNN